jgi:putative DNA primase/helicase
MDEQLYAEIPPILYETAPTASAMEYLKRHKNRMIVWRGDVYEWDGRYYEKRSKEEVKADIRHFLDRGITHDGTPFRSTIKKVDEVVAAVRQTVLVPDRFESSTSTKDGAPMNAISCHNGLLNIHTGKLTPHSSDWLVLNTLPFEYDPTLPEPAEWLEFVHSLWPNDTESISTLQEMLGYLISGDTDQQKIFLLLGPTRCGKGTISQVIKELIGEANYSY